MRKFEFARDGDAGWLILRSPDLAKVGKTRRHFSNASLISPKGLIALYHALDALLFLRVWNTKIGPHEIVTSQLAPQEVATWSPFGSKGIDPGPFGSACDFNQAQTAAEVAEEERAAAAYEMQMQERAYHSQDPPEEWDANMGFSLP